MNMATFFDQTKWYSTQKKRLFQMAYFKFHERNYWESSKLTNSKITSSRENPACFISCKPPHKNHPREYFGTTLCFIQIATSIVEKSQILSVAFHLAATVAVHTPSLFFQERKLQLHYWTCDQAPRELAIDHWSLRWVQSEFPFRALIKMPWCTLIKLSKLLTSGAGRWHKWFKW